MEPLEGGASFGWTITPGDGGQRTFFLRASTEEEQQQWMEAICEAQLRSQDHGSHACVVQWQRHDSLLFTRKERIFLVIW